MKKSFSIGILSNIRLDGSVVLIVWVFPPGNIDDLAEIDEKGEF